VPHLRRFISLVASNILFKQFLFALLLLSLSRITWLLFNHFWLAPLPVSEMFRALGWGVYFDLPVTAYFLLPMWVWLLAFPDRSRQWERTTRALFVCCIAACLLLNAIDTMYSRITTRRSGYELFATIGDAGNHIAPYIWDYIAGVLALLLGIFLIYRMVPTKGSSLYLYRGNKWITPVKVALVAGLWVLAARGGFRLKPLQSVDAGQFANARLVPLVSSTPLQLISTWGQPQLQTYLFMDQEVAKKLVYPHDWQGQGMKKPDANIVFIVVESLARDYTGFLNNQPFTPFLDSLSKRSVVFPFCYANGIRSIEMVPSIFCGIPALMDEHYINSIYASNEVENIFSWFSGQGYSSAFFHGATNGTMRFQSFLSNTGLKNYYGLSEYPDKDRDYDGSWGIYDEPYLQYMARYLDTVKKPFFTSVFTLTSHHPYKVPDQYKGVFPKGPLPIHETVAYTDMAIRKFFEYAKTTRWYENTVFVITGDHTSHSKHPYFYSQTGHYEIPLLIFSENLAPQTINKTLSQCDIVPTLLDLLDYKNNWPSFGRSVLDKSYAGYSMHRDNRTNYIVQYPYTLGMDDAGGVNDFYLRYRNKTSVEHLPRKGEQFEAMLQYLKAYLQVYSQSLRENHSK
jgi:phosphoglycerol transferase MdoB-like AlkP superfamily enzyme